jgi:hypothetical protein
MIPDQSHGIVTLASVSVAAVGVVKAGNNVQKIVEIMK